MRKLNINGEVMITIICFAIAGAIAISMVHAETKNREECNKSYQVCVSNHGKDCNKVLELCK